ncbi:MAG: hypothetical protein GTN38_01415 [Candidatus Aenigmarchaeota archaeon]|nr:hypothetical protein [Candidatus Aenigmarchaeota archaeon]NIQ17523.1 hypothetical protein [Candidatus Aenigmarchaeota archaeon]NIS73101.1 hypothetical protein [Candidatus Aenigmarchaeota archaeon]
MTGGLIRIVLSFVFLCMVLALSIHSALAQADENSLFVYVFDEDGMFFSGATVRLDYGPMDGERSSIGTSYTAMGPAEFHNLSPGTYTITVSGYGYLPAYQEFLKESGVQGNASLIIQEEPAGATGSARIALFEKYAPQTKQYILNGYIELLDPAVSDDGIPLVVASSGTESGEVIFSDLPVGFYTVQATAPGHISETPTIQINANAETWLPIGMDMAECKELEAGHNGDIKNRHNIILIANDYDNIENFKQRMQEIINLDGYNESGLLSDMPLADYKDRFNVFYVDKLFDSSNFVSGNRLCTEIDRNRQVIRFIFSSYGGGTAALCGGIANVNDVGSENATDLCGGSVKDITSHEFGHSFGCLYDEYSYHHSACAEGGCQLPQYVNCDIANTSVGCPKWCKNTPVSAEELSARVCSTYTSNIDCYAASSEGKPCGWLKDTSTCMNIVSYCYTFTAQYACDFDSYGFCQWSTSQDPYFQANCIPIALDNIDIGKGCESNTGCYKVCQYINWYSSTVASKMKHANLPFGRINSEEIVRRVNKLGYAPLSPYTVSDSGIITYDEVRSDGTISGGILDIDAALENPRVIDAFNSRYGEVPTKQEVLSGYADVVLLAQYHLNKADLTNDGEVDISDTIIVASNFGLTSGFDPVADTNFDGKVDIFDIVFVASRFTDL